MLLTDKQKQDIIEEFNQWKDKMYSDKTLKERQDYGQFFTPPELTIQMLEKFENLEGKILDPALGAGHVVLKHERNNEVLPNMSREVAPCKSGEHHQSQQNEHQGGAYT